MEVQSMLQVILMTASSRWIIRPKPRTRTEAGRRSQLLRGKKKDVDYASVASQAQWAIDDRLFVARGNGSEMVCADSMHIKIENLRELRKVAELTYRRMHICHSEKAQEFWLAGADPVGSGTYKNLFGASGPSGSETTGGRTNPGFCQQYSQYRSASVTEDKLLSDDTKALNEVILHSFPNCARTSGILKMTGSSTLRGHAINRHKADAALLRAFTTQACSGRDCTTDVLTDGAYTTQFATGAGNLADGTSAFLFGGKDEGTVGVSTHADYAFYNATDQGSLAADTTLFSITGWEGTGNIKYSYGDKRCVAFYNTEYGQSDADQAARYQSQKFETQKDSDGNDSPYTEVIVPRTCLMYTAGLLDTKGDTSRSKLASENPQQCDEWFRDCAADVILRARNDSLYGDGTAYDANNVNHFWAGDVNADSYDRTTWGDDTKTGFGTNTSNGSHAAAHCTQRKPIWSPLLQSCSYTANYNTWPPKEAISSANTYLDDVYITTAIASAREDMETCLEEVRSWFDPMWTHYALCRRGEGIGNDDTLCEAELREWESAVCVYLGRQEEICNWLQTCLDDANTTCHKDQKDIAARVEGRKVDYESSQRIECLLEAVSNFGESCVCDGLCSPEARHAAGYSQSSDDNNVGATDLTPDYQNGVNQNVFNASYQYDTAPTAENAQTLANNFVPTPWSVNPTLAENEDGSARTTYRTADELMQETCQLVYKQRKQDAIDRCMVDMSTCNSAVAGAAECPEGFIYDTVNGTNSGTASDNPSLGWMLDTFGFPSRFTVSSVTDASFFGTTGSYDSKSWTGTSDTDIVETTCMRSRRQMTACVNGVFDLADGASTRDNVAFATHSDMQDKLHNDDLAKFLASVGSTTQYDYASQIKVTVLKATPDDTNWDVLSGNTAPAWCDDAAETVTTGANSVCPQLDGRSLVLTTEIACASGDTACTANNRAVGKIHMDTSIWNIDVNCTADVIDRYDTQEPLTGNDKNWVLRREECPQYATCESGDGRVPYSSAANAVLGVNSPLRERYFWQVPSSATANTGKALCGANSDTNCDASFQRIYYANEAPGSGSAVTQSKCNEETYFNYHYVDDSGNALATNRNAADHLVCKADARSYGENEDAFWAGHIDKTGTEFTTRNGFDRGATAKFECAFGYGGPTSGYANTLAGHLSYVSSGKHCFKIDPCPASKRLVPFPTAYKQVTCSGSTCTQTGYDTTASSHTEFYCEVASGNAGAHSSESDAYGTKAAQTAGFRG